MNMEAILHSGIVPDLYLSDRRHLHIRLRTAREDAAVCELVCFTRTTPCRRVTLPMKRILRDGQADFYEATVSFPQAARYLKYFFQLQGKDGTTVWINAWGISCREPEDGFFEFLYANEKDCIRPPEWAAGQIYYQIFPDRFCNGDKSSDPPGCLPWGSPPDREHSQGGDLKGILSKLDYLEHLGVECLYLTPIFKADFNHKYATEDYFQVDPAFGDKETLKTLVRACHERKLRVLLDGVFNHCGTGFAPFRDLLQNQEASPYRDWFLVTRFPVTVSTDCYECVGAYPYMPRLNTSHGEVRHFILRVMRYWLEETGIDGWRLDVSDEPDGSVWTQARTELKEEFPDCLLLGETWGNGYKLMLGNQMDSIMNYGFLNAVRDYLATERIDAKGFNERFNHLLAVYPAPLWNLLYNPLDSHDTERFLTLCGRSLTKMKLAAALLFLLPGSPAIFYGDEAGVEGENDPDCRKAFPWAAAPWKQPLFAWYRTLIRLRRQETAIRTGSFLPVLCEGKAYGFCRRREQESIYVLCNLGEEKQFRLPVPEGGTFRQLIPEEVCYSSDTTDSAGVLVLTAPAESVIVIKCSKEAEKEKEEKV